MVGNTRSVDRLSHSKNACAAFTSASREANSSLGVTSQRNCRHSIAIGLNQGLYVGKYSRAYHDLHFISIVKHFTVFQMVASHFNHLLFTEYSGSARLILCWGS
jgi:hypothetical protein